MVGDDGRNSADLSDLGEFEPSEPAEIATPAPTPTPPGADPRAPRQPSRALARILLALAVVWALSFGGSLIGLTGPIAAVWAIATLLVVPLGRTLTDRLVALLLLGAVAAGLIAWFTPLVPWLVGPPVLAGLFGTMAAIVWGLGWTRRPAVGARDWTSIGVGVITGLIFWSPYIGATRARMIGVLSSGFDQPAHVFMWMRVWANHGYLIVNTLPDPDYWDWRVYPQGAQAVFADVAAVVTGQGIPTQQQEQYLSLFVILLAGVAGALALVTAWSVDRLCRGRRGIPTRRVVALQIVAAVLVALGPSSVVLVQSLSYGLGLVAAIPSVALAATARRTPRLAGVLVAASLAAAAAIYPICALIAVVAWPLYLWTSRHFWLASSRRRWYAVLATVAAAALCAPMFALLAFRHVDHNWDTYGYFQTLHTVVYVAMAVLLAVLIVMGRGRVPRPVIYATWVAAIVTVLLAAEAILQWLTAGDPSYYSVKTMYLAWMLGVIAVASAAASIRRRDAALPVVGTRTAAVARKLVAGAAAVALLATSVIAAVALDGLDQRDVVQGWSRAVSREAWVLSTASLTDRFGRDALAVSDYSAAHDGVTVVLPCSSSSEQTYIRWAMFLHGGMTETQIAVLSATCDLTTGDPLGLLPVYLRGNPEVIVNAIARDADTYEYAVKVKETLKLSNLKLLAPLPKQL
ncbi:MAG: hypothetical protein WCP28_01115 [Actinomycetes bacterium]